MSEQLQVDLVVKEFKDIFRSKHEVVVSAPGRLDFLNTHQDYKGLPVVAVGIDLRTYVAIRRSGDRLLIVGSGNMLDEGSRYLDIFPVDAPNLIDSPKWFGNYVRAAVSVLKEDGYSIDGARIWIRSWIPMGSGLGSSGTLLVSLIGAFNELFGFGLDTKAIAEYAYRAEHDIMGIPCGRLDQYAAAFGNIVYIETRPPYNIDILNLSGGFFAVIDTGIRHSTAEIHPKRQKEIEEGLSKLVDIVPRDLKELLGLRYWEPRWEYLDLTTLIPYIKLLDEKPRDRILYTLKSHRSTILALKAIKGRAIDVEEISETLEVEINRARELLNKGVLDVVGEVMTYQHKLLSKLYDVSLPQIDSLVEKLIEFGALGAKLSGAGLGGAVIALFRDKETAEKAVKNIIDSRYGVRGWIVKIDRGLTVHGDDYEG